MWVWEWEWDGWTKRRKERFCCLFTFTFTFHHLLGSFSRVGGNQFSTTKQKVEKGKKKKNKVLDFSEIVYCKEVLDFPIIEYHISFLSPIFHVRSDTLATNLGTQVH